jgi:LacI family transcriptional regulator
MPTNPSKVITIKEVAARAGLSLATVSYALRNHPKIPAPTREHVLRVAQELGYRPNPRVASLMAHIRRARGPSAGERIGFVWVHTPKEETREDPFLRVVLAGAQQRAEQLGYQIEEFWTEDRSMSDRRLSNILKSRGITGVLFSPVMHEVTVALNFEWEAFACAVIGHARWNPEQHHAGHHHYHGMRSTLEELERLGCKRPAVILNPEVNERGRRAWQAAFLVFHPTPRKAPGLILPKMPASAAAMRRWLRLHAPDALILHRADMVRQVQAWLKPGDSTRLCCLHWSPDLKGVPGIDQRFDLVAGNAVDLVVSQLIANERGLPETPRVTLFPGQWIPAEATPATEPATT